jgi:Glycosyl transferase family 90
MVKKIPPVVICICLLGTALLGTTLQYGAMVERLLFAPLFKDDLSEERSDSSLYHQVESTSNIAALSMPTSTKEPSATTEQNASPELELGVQRVREWVDDSFRLIDESYLDKITFQFPSKEQRIHYYMGSWYTPSKYSIDALCEEVPPFPRNGLPPSSDMDHTKPYLFDQFNIEAFPTTKYIPGVKKHVLGHSTNSTSFQAVMSLGDSQHGEQWPVIIKSRRIYNSKKKSILALLNERRHYQQVDIVKEAREITWDKKKDVLIWRGSTTGKPWEPGSRLNVVKRYYNSTEKGIDIAFSRINLTSRQRNFSDAENYVRDRVDEIDMLQYKYLLSIEGNDVATGLKWMLYSNSLVFMPPPRYETWAMEGLLVPYYHYIPVAPDYHDLLEKLEWARKYDKACQTISKQATQFMEDLYVSEQAKQDTYDIHQEIVQRYEGLYTKELGKCRAVVE